MNRYLILTLFVFVISTSPIAGETLSCSYTESLEEGHSYGIELTLVIEHDRPINLVYSGYYSNGEEGGAHFCTLDTGSIDFLTTWTEKGPLTLLTIMEPDRKDIVHIEKNDNGYEVRFVDMGRYYCAFGAEFPVAVTIERNNTECRVTNN
jgi:hypothetical protein